MALRIPDRTESELYTVTPDREAKFSVTVNGKTQPVRLGMGMPSSNGPGQAGDRVELSLPMEVERVRCDARVVANRGRVAVQRGPLVYSFEDVDHEEPVERALLTPDVELKPVWQGDLMGGVMVLKGGTFTAVPNYARLNRGGASQVWIRESPCKTVPSVCEPALSYG